MQKKDDDQNDDETTKDQQHQKNRLCTRLLLFTPSFIHTDRHLCAWHGPCYQQMRASDCLAGVQPHFNLDNCDWWQHATRSITKVWKAWSTIRAMTMSFIVADHSTCMIGCVLAAQVVWMQVPTTIPHACIQRLRMSPGVHAQHILLQSLVYVLRATVVACMPDTT